MRRSLALALVFAAAVVPALPVSATDQAIQPLGGLDEQRIEVLTTDEDQQRVVAIAGSQEQDVGEHIPPTPNEKAASKTGKFLLGVASAGVALGVMAASLLLL